MYEKSEALERQEVTYQTKMDQQYEAHNQERRELIEKNETSATKIAQLEREKITLENQVES